MNDKERETYQQQWKDAFNKNIPRPADVILQTDDGRVLQPGTPEYKQKETEIKRRKGLV